MKELAKARLTGGKRKAAPRVQGCRRASSAGDQDVAAVGMPLRPGSLVPARGDSQRSGWSKKGDELE